MQNKKGAVISTKPKVFAMADGRVGKFEVCPSL